MSDDEAPQVSVNPPPKKNLGRRREKYTPRACVPCQQRKVKCSGEDVCRQCRTRNVDCIYASATNKRKRPSPESDQPCSNGDFEMPHAEHQPELTDSGLQDRVRKLEETLRVMTAYDPLRILEPSQPAIQTQEAPPSTSNWPAILTEDDYIPTDLTEDDSIPTSNMVRTRDGETDTFEALVLKTDNLSLSSQLASLRKNLGLGAIINESRARSDSNTGSFLWELLPPARLQHLLHIYFRDFECYLPYLDQNDTEFRISRLLEHYEYSDNKTNLSIGPSHYPLAALVCNIIAVAETMEPGTSDRRERGDGWPRYLQGLKLIQRCSSLEEIDLDLIRYYAVASGYLMHTEYLRAATNAISMAIQLACKAKLNDQTSWSNCTQEERMAWKKLWWTIYFMDRRIGQKNGTPYLIRDSEVNVEDFIMEHQETGESSTSPVGWKSRLSPTLYATNDDSRYLQALVDLARLWGQIWDQFFAVTAMSRGDSQAIAAMDARIVDLQNRLPARLVWDHPEIEPEEALDERQTRRRLLTLIRVNTLRLIIRQNPLVGDPQDHSTKQFCAGLAGSTIHAIAAFLQNFPSTQASGYFVSASLLECICQLVPVLQTPCTQQQRTEAMDAFRTAYKVLAELAQTIGSASRAVKALNEVFSVGEVVSLFKSMVAETEDGDMKRTAALSGKADLNKGAAMDNGACETVLSPSIFDSIAASTVETSSQQDSVASRSAANSVDPTWESFSEIFSDQPSYSFDASLFLTD